MDDDREWSLSKFVDDTNIETVVETQNGRLSPETFWQTQDWRQKKHKEAQQEV